MSCNIGNYLIIKYIKVENSDKNEYIYSGYGIVFDGGGLWSFGNDFARNVVIFGVVGVEYIISC